MKALFPAVPVRPHRRYPTRPSAQLAEGAVANLVVLDRGFRVVRTFIDGCEVWAR